MASSGISNEERDNDSNGNKSTEMMTSSSSTVAPSGVSVRG